VLKYVNAFTAVLGCSVRKGEFCVVMIECCYNRGVNVMVNSEKLIGATISDGINEVPHKPMSF
jgi:hypothetical protein